MGCCYDAELNSKAFEPCRDILNHELRFLYFVFFPLLHFVSQPGWTSAKVCLHGGHRIPLLLKKNT